MKKTEEKVINFISSRSLISKGDKVLIALSGGPDSVFLLYFLNKFRNKYKIDLAAFHLNHKLRGTNSVADQKFCRALCESLNVPLFEAAVNIQSLAKKLKSSVEEAGRITRYRLLNAISSKNGFNKIATAHIKDDNTETVLLNLIKGSGVTGMTGIPDKRENIIRPVLCLTKSEILDYLHFQKIEYRLDESNLSVDYERNFLRQNIIPLIKDRLNPSLDETLFSSSFIFKSLKDFIEKYIAEATAAVVTSKKNELIINIEEQKKYHQYLVAESLRAAVLEKWNISLSFDDVKRTLELLTNQSGTFLELQESLLVHKDRGRLIIRKKVTEEFKAEFSIKPGQTVNTKFGKLTIDFFDKKKIQFKSDPNKEFISADHISEKLIIRKWQAGDKFIPLGMKGEKKVSDFLIDIKMSRLDKQNQYVLADGKKIIWLIGKRIDNRYRITDKTKKVLELCWNPKKN